MKHINIAPNKAKQNTNAIGINILPSTPESERIGMKTIKIIICPNIAERIIFVEPTKVIWSIYSARSSFGNLFITRVSAVILKAINSTIITAPSIIIPKSIAPKLIKLASTPKIFIRESANNIQSGITEATTSPDLKLPSSSITTKRTIKKPNIKFSAIVKVVLPINSLLSKKALILTPLGKDP